jgi:hypothetical protein
VRRAAHHALFVAVLASASLAGAPARAEEPPVDAADGPTACKALRERNERELAAWQKQQPATPYVYPREKLILDAPWVKLLDSLGTSGGVLLASIIPHVGAQLRAETPAFVVSWPWSFPLGPPSTCTRKQGSFNVNLHRPHRAMLEPGIVASNRGVGIFVRPGYRYIHHPSDWVVGVGGGLGSTIEVAGNREPFRIGIGPEALLHFGHCCESSYFTLAVRYDRFFTGTVLNLVTGSLGYTFF